MNSGDTFCEISGCFTENVDSKPQNVNSEFERLEENVEKQVEIVDCRSDVVELKENVKFHSTVIDSNSNTIALIQKEIELIKYQLQSLQTDFTLLGNCKAPLSIFDNFNALDTRTNKGMNCTKLFMNKNDQSDERHTTTHEFLKSALTGLSSVHGISSENNQKSPEDILFDMFSDERTNLIPIEKLFAALKHAGLRKNDTRLREFVENLENEFRRSEPESRSAETQKLNRDTFKKIVSSDIVLISRACRDDFIIPDFQEFNKSIEQLYWRCKTNTEGKVATYIPQLAQVSPEHWGVSACTIDGQRYSIGDATIPFPLQSCSKPLMYGIALETLGQDVVHKYVGQEPSGQMFNELVLDHSKKPHNPMINAGAILVCSLVKTLVKPEMTLAGGFDYTMSFFRKLAGGEYVGFDHAMFSSEIQTADRNYALGFYMREHKCFPPRANLKESMDFYFQSCSMEVNCESMSIIAATLANGGICPTTGETVLRPDAIRDVLSLMHSCGMYDYSGQFAFKVGLPTKSGVSGGMLIVIPNVMGICTWSPPLDFTGNSCRGVQFCEELVAMFNFHPYDNFINAAHKIDPRKRKHETQGLNIVNLLFSAANGDLVALKRHKLSGLNMGLSDYEKHTALHLAAAEGHLDCVKFLVEKCGVPPNTKDMWGNTPTDEATSFGRRDVVNYLKSWEKSQSTEGDPE